MSRRISKTQRWLDLISFLVGRRFPVEVSEIMERVPPYAEHWGQGTERARATALRTFERDKEELRGLGIPLETVTYTINYGHETAVGYRIGPREFYLPYLSVVSEAQERRSSHPEAGQLPEVELTETDADAVLESLHRLSELPDAPFSEAARSAFRKLAFDLEPDFMARQFTWVAPADAAPHTPALVSQITQALRARSRIQFAYRAPGRAAPEVRAVEPYGLVFQASRWYLVGRDVMREAIREFRVDRIDPGSLELLTPDGAGFSAPEDFDIARYLHREAWELGGDEGSSQPVRVRFAFPLSLLAERSGWGTLEATGADGATLRLFRVQRPDPFLRWVLTFGGEATIDEPREMTARLRALAESVLALGTEGGADAFP